MLTFSQVCDGATTNAGSILRLRCRCDILSVHEIRPPFHLFIVQHHSTMPRRSPQKGEWDVVRNSADGATFYVESVLLYCRVNTIFRWRLSADISLCQIDTRKSTATCTKATSWHLRHTSVVMSKPSKRAYSAATLTLISRSFLLQRKRYFLFLL